MKLLLCLLMISTHAFAATSEEQKLFSIKVQFEGEAYKLKLQQEEAIVGARSEEGVSSLQKALSLDLNDQSCVEWVYQGSASRTEAAAACSGVVNMDCLNWVYQGSASRLEAARACSGVTDMQCVEWVYQGSASRIEAAQSCQGGRRHPRRPGDC